MPTGGGKNGLVKGSGGPTSAAASAASAGFERGGVCAPSVLSAGFERGGVCEVSDGFDFSAVSPGLERIVSIDDPGRNGSSVGFERGLSEGCSIRSCRSCFSAARIASIAGIEGFEGAVV